MKFLIVGLGNIGDEYSHTRHNIGFDILDYIALQEKAAFSSDRLADRCIFKHRGKTLVMIKPTTFMNLSGKAVNYWMQKEKLSSEQIFIVTDDIALPLGSIRIRQKGNDGGHNGLKNIIEFIASSSFPRLRFGIGSNFAKGQQVEHVLSRWSDEEKKLLEERIKVAADAIKSFAAVGIVQTMNKFNNK